MKKTFTIAAAVFAATVLNANPVNVQLARSIAARQLGANENTLSAVLDSRAVISTYSLSEAPYYIFNNPSGGFAIIAGDDCLTPVIGYSTTGNINPARLPENLKYWLGLVGKAVEHVRVNHLSPSDEAAREWANPVRPDTKAGGKLLQTANWSQDNPYNWYCPIAAPYETAPSITGCVATAMSIVMHYHQWPPCGTGDLPGYDMYYYDSSGNLKDILAMPGHSLGHEYKWSIMPTEGFEDSSNKTPTEGQKQVAWLMYDCGIMVQAEYSTEGTGALSQYIPARMRDYMHYKRSTYMTQEAVGSGWVNLLKEQIDRGLPLIYGANDSNNGGHQFVVCGYDSSNKLYVNWGWDGDCNGYFAISAFKPSGTGYNFNQNHDAIIDLEPDRSITPVPVAMAEPANVSSSQASYSDPVEPSTLYLEAGQTSKGYQYYGIVIDKTKVSKGDTFLANAGLITNPGSSRYTGAWRLDQYSYDGTYIGTLWTKNSSYVDGKKTYYFYDMSCTASYNVNLGDNLRLYTATSASASNSSWTFVDAIDDDYTTGRCPMIDMPFIDPDSKDRLVNTVLADFWAYNIEDTGSAYRAEIVFEDGMEVVLLEK